MRRVSPALLALLALLACDPPVHAQTAPIKFLSVASTNSNLVLSGKVLLGTGVVVNTTAAVYFLKFYNKATAPVCGTDVPKWTVPIPFGASSSGGGFVLPLGQGIMFPLGLGFCITSGIADNDTGNAAAGIVVNLGVGKQ
jgi:hypothetical protein